METEIEGKWLNIDAANLRKILESLGATLVRPERLMTRKTFDDAEGKMRSVGGWVRVRNEGEKITMSYKQLNDRTAHGTKEVTIVVDDFENTCLFLDAVGLITKSFQETKRESWTLNGAEIEIDTWPWIPTFVEIEAKSEDALKQTAAMLGLDYAQVLHGSVETAYQAVYDVTDEEIDGWPEIRFSDVPDWLVKKTK